MKKFAITAIVALGVAAPALAQTQLESSVGAAPGQYTLSQLVRLKAASTIDGGEGRVFLGNPSIEFSSRNAHSSTAVDIFKRLADESREDE